MKIRTSKRTLALLIALGTMALPLVAQAQRRSPLEDAPAVRKRFELRSFRLEAGAGYGTTINQDFYHTQMLNLKLGFHITDWLSVSGFGAFGVANLSTGFRDKVLGSLNTPNPSNRQPTAGEAQASMQKISSILGLQLEFVPFTGKYSLFGKLFAAYDFYVLLGPGFINVAPNDSGVRSCSDTANVMPGTNGSGSCAVSGLKPGVNFGVGFHSYFNNWLALNVELRDILAQLNPAGRDVNGDNIANNSDLSWTSTYMLSANLVFYLPPTADISP
jgi:outer membrane beta-barrel protein